MSKTDLTISPPTLGLWLRQARQDKGYTLREVADAAGMDLAHLQKIESGLRLPTEQQTIALARFFGADEKFLQARRIAEKFRNDYADHPAAMEAISLIAEEAPSYRSLAVEPTQSKLKDTPRADA